MKFPFWQNATDNQRLRCFDGGDGLKEVFELDSNVDVDIEVDIYANVGNSRLGKMPRAPSVCVGGRCGWLGRRERLDVVCDLGPGLRGPYTRPPAEGEGPYTRPNVVRSTIRKALGRTDRCGTGGAGIGSLTKRD